MNYVTPFFQKFYPSFTHVDYHDLVHIQNAESIAVDCYNNSFEKFASVVHSILPNTKVLHLYLGEPTDEHAYINFLHEFDQPNVHFYSDSVLNFGLTNASFTPTINWFIDPVNYYTEYQWAKYLLLELQFSKNKPYLFDILLGQEKCHRNFLSELVTASPYYDRFIYSYFKDDLTKGISWDNRFDISLTQVTSSLIRRKSEDIRLSAVLPVDIYNQSYFSVVCETTAFSSYNQYTEKVIKPMLGMRPFVVFAGQNYLNNLRSLGFHTFNGIIDESYDTIVDEKLRFITAWREVERLCQQDPVHIYEQALPILIHNKQHFLTTDWANPIKHLF